MLNRLSSDEIPNIRFNVAKSYDILIGVLKRLPDKGTVLSMEKSGQSQSPSSKGTHMIQSQIMPDLERLQNDDDVDVRFFASKAASNVADSMVTSP